MIVTRYPVVCDCPVELIFYIMYNTGLALYFRLTPNYSVIESHTIVYFSPEFLESIFIFGCQIIVYFDIYWILVLIDGF